MRLVPLVITALLAACGAPPGVVEDAGPLPNNDAGGSDGGGGGAPDGGGADAGDTDGGGGGDAGRSDGGVTDAGPFVVVYPGGRAQSPLDEALSAGLRAIAARGPALRNDVFCKVGDSHTVSTNYLSCFAGTNVDLAGRTALVPTIDHFKAGVAGTTTPFDRTSLAAGVGWNAGTVLAGAPSPLERELTAVTPRLATVMFGTNDVGFADPHSFGRNLFTIVDTLLSRGIVPIVSSVPSRNDSATADAWVLRYNLVARGVAQARRVPFVDLHRELLPLPSHGVSGDGIHLNVYAPSAARACVFTTTGLAYGNNTRNLVTLEALDRARVALAGGPAPDAAAPRRYGDGTFARPIVVDALPFVDLRDTRVDGASNIATYPGCASTADEAGPEVLYRLDLTQPATVRALVVSLDTADVDVHLLSDPPTGQSCVARSDKMLVATLQPGRHWLSLDTFVAAGSPKPGEYLFAVLAE